jgi:hypothetical protein
VVTGHKVFYKSPSAAAFSEWTPEQDDTSPTQVTGLRGGERYSFYVRAYNSSGGSSSALGYATPVEVPAAPVVTVSLVTGNSARLSWLAPASRGSTITQYKVLEYSQSGTWIDVATNGSAVRSYTAVGHHQEHRKFTVRACSVVGCSVLPSSPDVNVTFGVSAPAFLMNITPSSVMMHWVWSDTVGRQAWPAQYVVPMYKKRTDTDWSVAAYVSSMSDVNKFSEGTSVRQFVVVSGLDPTAAYDLKLAVFAKDHQPYNGWVFQTPDAESSISSIPANRSTTTSADIVVGALGNPSRLKSSACAIVGAGSVKCWGYQIPASVGSKATSPLIDLQFPTGVVNLSSGVVQLVFGSPGSAIQGCARMSAGSVRCWGDLPGTLADGVTSYSPVPVPLPGLASGVKDIKFIDGPAGSGNTLCATFNTGPVKCVGDLHIDVGLGIDPGTSGYAKLTAAPWIPRGFIAFSTAIPGVGCVVGTYAAETPLKCWGDPAKRAWFGIPDTADFSTPTVVPGLTDQVTGLALSPRGGCAMVWVLPTVENRSGASVLKCFGHNDAGQLGIGTSDSDLHGATLVPGLERISSVTVAGDAVCATDYDGPYRFGGGNGLYCWGTRKWTVLGSEPASMLSPFRVQAAAIPKVVGDGSTICWSIIFVGWSCAGPAGSRFNNGIENIAMAVFRL